MSELTPTKAWIYAGLIVAGGVGAAVLIGKGGKPMIKKGQRVLLIGDSLSVGLNYPMKALAKEAGVDFMHVGKEGSNIKHFAVEGNVFDGRQLGVELRQALKTFQPYLVLVSLGTNDEAIARYNRSANVVQMQSPHLATLMTLLKASAPEVAWIGPPPNSFMIPGLRQLIRDAVGSKHYFESGRYQIPKQPDNIHPTPKGYAGWAGLIWRWVSTGVAPAATAPRAP